jgi:manganese/zinc/iron transport system permease protein
MSPSLEIILIACAVAVACSLVGTFLVLRQMAMMSDAISHSVLLGIVLAFFAVRSLSHPLVIVGAALTGVLTVTLVELLSRSQLVKKDAAIGLVFPALFSVAVLLINRYAGSVHLDQDSVLLGELVFAPFTRATFLGLDLPASLWKMIVIALINLAAILLFYKELKLATFDAGLAAALGFSPAVIHYGLMVLVSVTAVGAFDAVGAVLVVALIVVPPATAYLLTDRLPVLLALGAGIGVLSATSGYALARAIDGSIAGSMATMTGAFFLLAFFLAPERGLLAQQLRRRRQRREFAVDMLLVHLQQHENEADASEENAVPALHEHLRWDAEKAAWVLQAAHAEGLVEPGEQEILLLSPQGRARALRVLAR